MRPAEGVFLFHPRALERLQPARDLDGPRPAAEVCYHLMARRRFLERLEPENPEALSVIEGLSLPDWVLLLPMPGAADLRSTPERTLLRDYWARRFEGEVARAWQMARDDNQDLARFGTAALTGLIGSAALCEARAVLTLDGVPGASEGEPELCRAFVARVVRLRYFAAGTRGCCFPSVTDWAALDQWLEDGGLDLPSPMSGGRRPQLLERSRPAARCGDRGVHLPLPVDLPYGRSDPDRSTAAHAPSASEPGSRSDPMAGPAPDLDAALLSHWQARSLDAVRQGMLIRRRGHALSRLADGLEGALFAALDAVLDLWPKRSKVRLPSKRLAHGWRSGIRLRSVQRESAAAQRAEWDGRFAATLRHLGRARARYARLIGARLPDDPVDALLDQRQRTAAESFANLLAVNWRLPQVAAGDLQTLILRLAAERGPAAPTAQAVLDHLEITLLECRNTYYRIALRGWLTRGYLRQALPFLGGLKGLAALDAARQCVEALPWPVADLDRLGVPLAALTERIGQRLEGQLGPRIQGALAAAGLVPESTEGQLAADRLKDALVDLIRERRHLKFSDVRDLLSRDTLSLPDIQAQDLWEGDRLRRFDRAAARALAGVYQPGAFYVKGLQRLSAPLFGTRRGRQFLRLLLLPGLAAWAGLEVTSLVLGLFTPGDGHLHLTDPRAVVLLGVVLSAVANTRLGRSAVRLLWWAVAGAVRLLLFTGLRRFLRWTPVTWFLGRRLVRTVLDLLLAPLALGLTTLLPLVVLWLLAMHQRPGLAVWVAALALAFAIGTVLRETPGGRRLLDDWVTSWRRVRDGLRQERLADLVAPVMDFFKGATRALTAGLHRIRTLLNPRLGEPVYHTVLKALVGPPWAVCEAVIEFYVVVLIEPQTNPVKHFPVVTLGHKLMLPFLPALSGGLYAGLSPFMPDIVALPLAGVTIFLLPGLFGFLFWEMKENWRLYAANRTDAVPLARLGAHGETITRMLRRGLHGGGLPKAFDRLRQELARQVLEETPDPRELRRVLGRLRAITTQLARFGEQELGEPLREACRGDLGTAGAVVMEPPRIATQSVAFNARLELPGLTEPVALTLDLAAGDSALQCAVMLTGPVQDLGADCRARVADAVRWFARRCGAAAPESIAALENPVTPAGAR